MATTEDAAHELDPGALPEIDIEALDHGGPGAASIGTLGTATCPASLGTWGSF